MYDVQFQQRMYELFFVLIRLIRCYVPAHVLYNNEFIEFSFVLIGYYALVHFFEGTTNYSFKFV